MPSTLVNLFILILAALGGFYQIYIHPLLKIYGVFDGQVQNIGTRDCYKVEELQTCEKAVLHQATGVIYFACSNPHNRAGIFNSPHDAQKRVQTRTELDYLATYDPSTKKVTRLSFTNGFTTEDTSAVHGMDVVPNSSDPKKLWIYLVNHRVPKGDPPLNGLDSVIELFEMEVGSTSLTHIKTFDYPEYIIHPNDVVGSPDGKSFYFTNHVYTRTPQNEIFAYFHSVIVKGRASIGYCHIDKGCKLAATGLPANNGLASTGNGTWYLASTFNGGIRVFEEGNDNDLVLVDTIPTKYGLDNLSIDKNGAVWAAAFPKMFALLKQMTDIDAHAPSAVFRLAANTGADKFYGKKYVLDIPWQENGTLALGSTTFVHDADRKRLITTGIMAPWVTVCNL
ncbi:hypothetical protein MVEN_01760200 [Mycena venus]|uniref:Serum paraoxonase/arylesterase n=1 Tax=Mycena venus TaxID=2733690 RepID=A0A8H6XMU0_9AGAR|nr:hypothetical protein MVEN_01760200 [Mycena venus]